MTSGGIFSRAKDILRYIRTRRRRRLYEQWVERAELPPEAAPKEEPAPAIVPKLDKKETRLSILYVMLGAGLVILSAGLILLALHSC